MRSEEPIIPTTCNHCGKPFNTSQVHPRQYCSIACEEGRAPRAQSDPAADDYWLHLQGEPEALVGKWVVASCLKRTCYSPEWHRDPSSYSRGDIVSHDEKNEILVYRTDKLLGTVDNYENGEYRIRYEDDEGCTTHFRWHDASMVVSQIRRDRWWAEG